MTEHNRTELDSDIDESIAIIDTPYYSALLIRERFVEAEICITPAAAHKIAAGLIKWANAQGDPTCLN